MFDLWPADSLQKWSQQDNSAESARTFPDFFNVKHQNVRQVREATSVKQPTETKTFSDRKTEARREKMMKMRMKLVYCWDENVFTFIPKRTGGRWWGHLYLNTNVRNTFNNSVFFCFVLLFFCVTTTGNYLIDHREETRIIQRFKYVIVKFCSFFTQA